MVDEQVREALREALALRVFASAEMDYATAQEAADNIVAEVLAEPLHAAAVLATIGTVREGWVPTSWKLGDWVGMGNQQRFPDDVKASLVVLGAAAKETDDA